MIQEAVLAKKVSILCGSLSLPWSNLAQLADKLEHTRLKQMVDLKNGLQRFYTMNIIEMLKSAVRDNQTIEISGALVCTLRSQGTDPRNKVYSLLGFIIAAQEMYDDSMIEKVDYNIPVKTLSRDVAISILEGKRSLQDLSLIDHASDRCKTDWPSWAPRWDLTSPLTNHFGDPFRRYTCFRPSFSIPRE